MAIAPRALVAAVVQRLLPTAFLDDREADRAVRAWRYGELTSVSLLRKQQALNEEGTYFVANNSQTGIATPAVTSFGATTPLAIVYNGDSPTSQNYKRLSLDYLDLVTTAAGSFASAGVNLQLAVVIDNGNRYSSGGTQIAGTGSAATGSGAVSPNMDSSPASIAKVYVGNLTATAATGSARTVCGLRILRPVVSATVADVVGETKHLNFGGVEAMLNGNITVANANQISLPLPPITIGPNQSALIYFIMNGTTPGAVSYAPEFGWNER